MACIGRQFVVWASLWRGFSPWGGLDPRYLVLGPGLKLLEGVGRLNTALTEPSRPLCRAMKKTSASLRALGRSRFLTPDRGDRVELAQISDPHLAPKPDSEHMRRPTPYGKSHAGRSSTISTTDKDRLSHRLPGRPAMYRRIRKLCLATAKTPTAILLPDAPYSEESPRSMLRVNPRASPRRRMFGRVTELET